MEIEDFLPRYPNIQKVENNLFNPYNREEFRDIISSKKEFVDLKLPSVETLPDRPGEMFNHQEMIARFLSSNTPYNELLLYHEMGTGKTCTAIACIEQLRKENNNIQQAYVFARGTGLLKNFVEELLFKCTGGQYIPDNYHRLKPIEKTHRIKKKTDEFYTFETFERFAKLLAKHSDDFIRDKFSNSVIVIDEIHNIRLATDKEADELDIYRQFNRFLHIIENRKILLMSGTPMKDQPAEIASVMNLILPKELQFDTQTFTENYFEKDGTTFKNGMQKEFIDRISGRISYLKSMISDVKKVFMGETAGSLKHFRVWKTDMSDFQESAYKLAVKRDESERSISIHARQASLFVFPDGTYGSEGFNKYVKKVKIQRQYKYILDRSFVRDITSVDSLRRYSCKYAELVGILENSGKTFVYCEYVGGSGSILLGLILQQFGYSLATGTERSHGKRYSIVTNLTSNPKQIEKTIEQFNSNANKSGEIVSVIIGSRVISEGFSLKGVKTEVILTPHWNYSETAQAIARGWRVGSHSNTTDVKELSVYQIVAIPKTGKSIDLQMYEISERKDMRMKAIENAIKISAFDCYLNRDRNYISGYDGMRECDYTACNYKCMAKPLADIDVVTFNAYYARDDELVVKFLRDHFLHNFFIEIEELQNEFKNNTLVQLLKTIRNHVENNTLFMDWRNIPHYLRMDKNVVFIEMDPSREADYYTSYYAQDVIVGTGSTFSDIVDKEIATDIAVKSKQVFKYPKHVDVTIPTLPPDVQLMLLKGCIEAEDKQLKRNVDARNAVMSYFNGSYVKTGDKWIVTLSTTPICLQTGGNVWTQCRHEDIPATDKTVSPIGYYGTINPKISDAFCIREVQGDTTDLRKIKVGKKCIDYSKSVLVDIVANRIKKDPDSGYLHGDTKEQLIQKAKDMKQVYKQEYSNASVEELKRIIFWGNKFRNDICVEIRKYMADNNLITVDYNCGVQNKKRAA